MAKRHLKPDQGRATKLPISNAQPAVKKGGRCDKRTPTGASVAHSAIAPKASHVARTDAFNVSNSHRAPVGRRDNWIEPWPLQPHA